MSVWGVLGLKQFFPHVATSGEYNGNVHPFLELPGIKRYTYARHAVRSKRIYDNGRRWSGGIRSKHTAAKAKAKASSSKPKAAGPQ